MSDDDIVMLNPGDPCPLCGEPIKTADPCTLQVLSILKHYLEHPDEAAHRFHQASREAMKMLDGINTLKRDAP